MQRRRPYPAHVSAPAIRRTAHRAVALVCIGLLALLSGCGKDADSPDAQLLRLSQRNEPATLDPQLATLPDEYFVLRALSEGLLVPNPAGGQPLAGVAETWSVTDGGRRYTFKLRATARWSNGEPVTAQDFIATFRRALTPTLGAPEARSFFVIRHAADFYRGKLSDFSSVGLSAPDPQTLVIDLEQPTPHLPALAASGPWLPIHPRTLERFGGLTARDALWARPGHFVGNGPFILREWRANQHLLVTPNPHYHAAARVHVAGIRFQIYDHGDTEERAFRAGLVDVTMAVPFTKLDNYEPPIRQRQLLHETRYFALNTTRPPLDDARVRRALALAIDRTSLVENVLRGGHQVALSFIPPGLGGYQGEARLQPDAATARALLAEAGFPNGKGFPRLELTTWVNTPVLEAVQQMWRRELGIETAIVQREGKVHMAALRSADFDVAFTPAIPGYDDVAALFEEFIDDAGNYGRWQNSAFDALVREAGHTFNRDRRTTLYHQAEAILLEDAALVPLYFNAQNFLIAPRVHGWQTDALWNRFYLDVSLE